MPGSRESLAPSTRVSALARRVDSFLSQHIQSGQRLLIAFSGGLDSRVLLQLLAEARPSHDFVLEAMHIHHGLSPNADHWSAFCTAECARLALPFHCVRVDVERHSGLGIEASARRARYAALLAHPADYILLAHHQDDQAETLLLQLLRGAGARGLAGMAMHDASRRLLRPLIDVPRSEVEAYARDAGLQWIEDESNLDTRYDRNFCRHEVFPLLEQRYPAAKSTLARSAAHIAEAMTLLDELALIDATAVIVNGAVHVPGLAALSEARARNLLRWWLASYGLPMPGLPRLQEMLHQLRDAGEKTILKVQVCETIYLRRYRGWASLSVEQLLDWAATLHWQGEDKLLLPANGQLLARYDVAAGLAMSRLQGSSLEIRYRQGGERFKPDARRPTRSLKQLCQEADIAPWRRERMPLIYLDDTLVLVPGIGVAADWQAQPGEPSLMLEWQPLLPGPGVLT